MSSYSFSCFGHKNILGIHRNTLEFTKDGELTLNGDCIIGVKADFDLKKVRELIEDKQILKIEISVEGVVEEVTAAINPSFCDKEEIVVRKSDFISDRTLGIKADKACIDLSRVMIEKMKNPEQRILVKFTTK